MHTCLLNFSGPAVVRLLTAILSRGRVAHREAKGPREVRQGRANQQGRPFRSPPTARKRIDVVRHTPKRQQPLVGEGRDAVQTARDISACSY